MRIFACLPPAYTLNATTSDSGRLTLMGTPVFILSRRSVSAKTILHLSPKSSNRLINLLSMLDNTIAHSKPMAIPADANYACL